MVTFIEYGGNFVPKHPCHTQRLTAFLFGIRGQKSKIQSLCDQTLNVKDEAGQPRGAVYYQVISDYMLMAFMDMQLVSLDPADANQGALQEKECTFVIPLLAWEEGRLPRLIFYMPYLWLNSGVPLIVGREIYGFPKHFGLIEMPSALGDPACWKLHADVLVQFDPTQVCGPQQIVDVRQRSGGNLVATQELSGTEAVFGTVLAGLGLPDAVGALDVFATLGWMPSLADTRLVFLKQFRDHAVAARACFQAVLEAPVTFPAFHNAQMLAGDFDIQFFNYASAPLATELGLASPQRAVFAVRANLAFDIGLGVTQWSIP